MLFDQNLSIFPGHRLIDSPAYLYTYRVYCYLNKEPRIVIEPVTSGWAPVNSELQSGIDKKTDSESWPAVQVSNWEERDSYH